MNSSTEPERIRGALQFIPANDRDTWLRMGMAVKSELGDAGRDLWDAWSQQADSYQSADALAVWRSVKANGKITIGTLFHEAKAHGWRDDGKHPKPTPEKLAEQQRINAERAAQDEPNQGAKHKATALRTAEILASATGNPATHPYAAEIKRGVPLGPRVKRGPWKQRDWPDALLVPIYQADGKVWSIEAINVNGKKDSRKDSKKAGGFHHFGKITGAKRVLIGEGLATVAAGVDADGSPAAAALTRSNLKAIGLMVRDKAAPDAEIIFLADHDPKPDGTNPGLRAAEDAARACGGKVAIPGTEATPCDFWDVWASAGKDAVRQAMATARIVGAASMATDTPKGDSDASGIVVVNLTEFVTRDIPPRERILAPWLLTQSLNMIYAWRGIGKTHVALGIAYATASGGTFLKWKAIKPRRVLYIDGEMPAASMQDRLKGLVASNDVDFDPDYFKLITPDLQTGAMPDLATADGQDAIDAIMGNTEMIVIDNLSCLARSGGRENDAESWLPIQPWALRQRQQGRSVLFLHHSGKGGSQRGTSKREDILDTVLTLKRPPDYNPADGAVFEVHFEKTREMHGDDAAPFEARLQTDGQGQSVWTYSSVEDSTFDRVVTLANDGLSQKDIALELNINKSNVSRHFRRATDAGLIQKGDKHDAF